MKMWVVGGVIGRDTTVCCVSLAVSLVVFLFVAVRCVVCNVSS